MVPIKVRILDLTTEQHVVVKAENEHKSKIDTRMKELSSYYAKARDLLRAEENEEIQRLQSFSTKHITDPKAAALKLETEIVTGMEEADMGALCRSKDGVIQKINEFMTT